MKTVAKNIFTGFSFSMDKINNISFTGIRNIGAAQFQRNSNSVSLSLSAILKDDFNGKDLTEFNSVLKKTFEDQAAKFKNPDYNDLLNVEFLSKLDADEGKVFVNGSALDVNNHNLPMFTYLAKMTRKIAGLSDPQMPVDTAYKSFYANETLVHGARLYPEETSFREMEKRMTPFFRPDLVRRVAKSGNEFIQLLMNRFLDI